MDAIVESEIGCDHGAVKDGKADAVEKMKLKAGEVAVREEWFGILADEAEVKGVEEVVGAVTATDSGEKCGGGIGEGGMKIGEALVGSSGEEERAASLRVRREGGREAEGAEMLKATVEAVRIRKGGG